jgi:uncharacterized NAD(P)/FAD-binding protein YdhS
MPSAHSDPIAVIGGGYSGTMAAIQLLRATSPEHPVLLCERASSFAAGIAYSTAVPGHLLNVRAANMSAFPSEPAHFQDWLAAECAVEYGAAHQTEAGVFASRAVYGRYLKAILQDAIQRTAEAGRVRLLPDEIVDIERAPAGFRLTSGGGRRYTAKGVVLATGHVPSVPGADPRYCTSPWEPAATRDLRPDQPVLILGTGLTMVDIVLALRQNGFPGPILALSRRGLVAERHRAAGPRPPPVFSETDRRSVRRLMRRLREEVDAAHRAGGDWRAVIDSIRPTTSELWRGLTEAERRRFLRHPRRWWDIHRHRMAPPNAEAIESQIRDGGLKILAGRVCAVESDPYHMRVLWRPMGRTETEQLEIQRILVATGLEHAARTTDPLMQRLLERGLVRWDGLGLGIDVGDDLRAVGASGEGVPNLWALGPIVRGVFWECVAVPDIRNQAEQLGREAALAFPA